MVAAVTVPSAFQARVLVARLASEGIVARTDGNDDGPYPAGPVGVLVEESRLAAALEVLGVLDDGPAPACDPVERSRGRDRRLVVLWVMAAVVLTVMLLSAASAVLTMTP